LPARISFQVASRTDSRVVLDEMGAEKLLGNGDMLFLWPGTSTLLRGQGTYLNDEEIHSVVDAVSTGEQNFVNELVNMKVEEPTDAEPGRLKKRDGLYESAVDVVVREGRGSVSLLQRALGIGYGRAARLIDYMAEDGLVGAYAGSQAREVLITPEEWERMQGTSDGAPAAAKPRRSNKIRLDSSWDEREATETEPGAEARRAGQPEEDAEEPDGQLGFGPDADEPFHAPHHEVEGDAAEDEEAEFEYEEYEEDELTEDEYEDDEQCDDEESAEYEDEEYEEEEYEEEGEYEEEEQDEEGPDEACEEARYGAESA
jgi:S-DNA-T family DNA segregation ATPase FtsK/SpoIIIE